MGSVLSPHYFGESAKDLPFASSFCGRCNEVCPMQIPLTKLMRKLREKPLTKRTLFAKTSMFVWSQLAKRPRLYNLTMKAVLPCLSIAAKQNWLMNKVTGVKAWQKHRTLPTIAKTSFQDTWKLSRIKDSSQANTRVKKEGQGK
jgi:L-lactate dehydrogenase complex protein LldF